ncbi:MAG: SbcC/MukB-like Walker B domain-containing protein [Lachnospiraceae bacterium]|nr:SbcC/MukB-like Walker B domain-containing protein [Lachnospiraceae bacterium]
MAKTRFEALSRIALNNWHYINHRILSFNEGINFFTGHSGSGKSTVIDAMQIVLYANTDGRGFFNKAAADDSDRSLIEYLRGMVNIGDNNEFSYLRNRNFSSTIVLELKQTDTERCQCVGVVFDVETDTNEISRLFFWHEGPMWENEYRTDGRTMTTEEVKDYLQGHYGKEDFYCGSHNERFRKQLYDIYLGGLDAEKFPLLFKRAIPFRMNIKLEDFVKEYICMEQDIHIEDMQESVMQYGRMQKKIADTQAEIQALEELQTRYGTVTAKREEQEKWSCFCRTLEIRRQEAELAELRERIGQDEQDCERQKSQLAVLDQNIAELTAQADALLKQVAESGYDNLKKELALINEMIEQLGVNKAHYQRTAEQLHAWTDLDVTYNSTIWAIESFEKGEITEGELGKLQRELTEIRKDVAEQQQDAKEKLRQLKKEEKLASEELNRLKQGDRAYPDEVEQARAHLLRRLAQETGKAVSVEVLADLLEIRNERWRNAVEGYLGGSKLSLIVEPRYAKLALELYRELDPKQYYGVAVLDTERIEQDEHRVLEHALSEEVTASRSYVRAYIDYQLGKVVKCESVEELRRCRIGVTADCVLYHSYRIQHMNPVSYTRMAYIGKSSMKQRMKLLKKQLEEIAKKREPQESMENECTEILNLEALSQRPEIYLGWLADQKTLKGKLQEKSRLEKKIEELQSQNVAQWEEERSAVLAVCDGKKQERTLVEHTVWEIETRLAQYKANILDKQELSLKAQDALKLWSKDREEAWLVDCDQKLQDWTQQVSKGHVRYGRLTELAAAEAEHAGHEVQAAWNELVDGRTVYLRQYVNRTTFSPTEADNGKYEELLERLSCDRLDEYQKIAAEQAKSAVEHFKDDFIYKIRTAIKEALERKDELNRVISRLDFGKDKYRFVIGRNKGAFGSYYDMFMDEALEINPSQLNDNMDYQLNMFSMEHENRYGELMNELISVFIPPENATQEQMEEAKRNMDRFADYRTYLSFDMEQLIENEEGTMKIGLSKMIRKNSGGEGQNPLYVALLASFAQAYRINLTPKLQRRPTIRLVVLDEAFSKMDSEKVASCIELIRGLGFQALISATNDKIQNYLENVDKTFVFANPGKKGISIQEFEKSEFAELSAEAEEST